MVHKKLEHCSKKKKLEQLKKESKVCAAKKEHGKKSDLPEYKSPSAPLIEFPHILRIIGPKQIKICMQFIPSALFYSAASLVLVTYMSEWKAVLQYLPYYNGKYVEENGAKSKDEDDAAKPKDEKNAA